MDAFKLIVRIVLSSGLGVLTFVSTVAAQCDDIGGVPTWERCTTWLGTPAFVEWPSGVLELVPLILGISVGLASWWVLSKSPLKAKH